MATEIFYTVQRIADGWDIGGSLYAEQDADTVRFWEADADGNPADGFCLLEVTRGDEGWVATGGDGQWVDLGELPFSGPLAALRAQFPTGLYILTKVDAQPL